MSDIKISQMQTTTALNAEDILPLVQDSQNKAIIFSDFLDNILDNIRTLSNNLTVSPSITTPLIIGSSGTLSISGNILPSTDDTLSLGSTSKRISDYYAASGHVTNYAAGDYTITHSTGLLTFSGGISLQATGLSLSASTNKVISFSLSPISNDTAGVWTFPKAAGTFANLDDSASQTFASDIRINGALTLTPSARSSGSAPYFTINAPTDLTLQASTETIGVSFVGATRQHATGAITLQREYVFAASTYSFVGASTITVAATADFASPIAGTNATLTKSVAGRFSASADAHIPLVLRGFSGTQTGSLVEFQTSAGGVGGSIGKFGSNLVLNGSTVLSGLPTIQAFAQSGVSSLRIGDPTFYMDFARNAGTGALDFTSVQKLGFTFDSQVSITQSASTGSPTAFAVTGASHVTLTASSEAIDVNFNLARTVQFATGAITTQRAMVVQAPTYGFVGASTISDAATVAISGPPVAGTNATITRKWSLWVQTGPSQFLGAGINRANDASEFPIGLINGTNAFCGFVTHTSTGNNVFVGSGNLPQIGACSDTGATYTQLNIDAINLLINRYSGAAGGGTGKVGIGVTAASYTLDIATALANDRGVNVAVTSTSGTVYGGLATVSGASTTNIGWSLAVSGATNNRALEITGPTSGANNYAIYSTATAQSLLSGALVVSVSGNITTIADTSISCSTGFSIASTGQLTLQPRNANSLTLESLATGIEFQLAALSISAPVRIGAFNAVPSSTYKLEVDSASAAQIGIINRGAASATGDAFQVQNSSNTPLFNIGAPAVQTTGSPTFLTLTPPAHTTLTASAEAIDVNFNLARTVQFSTGALTTQRAMVVQAPTYGFVGASTITTAVTAEFSSPIAGTNATLTNSYAGRFIASSAAHVPIVTQGATSQSGDWIQCKDSSGTTLASLGGGSLGSLSLANTAVNSSTVSLVARPGGSGAAAILTMTHGNTNGDWFIAANVVNGSSTLLFYGRPGVNNHLTISANAAITTFSAGTGESFTFSPASGSKFTTAVGIGVSPSYTLDITTAAANNRGVNVAVTSTSGTVYGIYSSVTGASTANYSGYYKASGATTNYSLFTEAGSATAFPLIIKAAGSQSASLTEWRNSSDLLMCSVSASGQFNRYVRNAGEIGLFMDPLGVGWNYTGFRFDSNGSVPNSSLSIDNTTATGTTFYNLKGMFVTAGTTGQPTTQFVGVAGRSVSITKYTTSALGSIGNISGGCIGDVFADVSTTHTDGTFDTLRTDTLVANALIINGDKILFDYTLTVVTHTTNTADFKLAFAGITVFDSTALTFAATGTVRIWGYIIRATSTTARATVSFSPSGSSTILGFASENYVPEATLTGLTLTGTNNLVLSAAAAGTGAASGDIKLVQGQIDIKSFGS